MHILDFLVIQLYRYLGIADNRRVCVRWYRGVPRGTACCFKIFASAGVWDLGVSVQWSLLSWSSNSLIVPKTKSPMSFWWTISLNLLVLFYSWFATNVIWEMILTVQSNWVLTCSRLRIVLVKKVLSLENELYAQEASWMPKEEPGRTWCRKRLNFWILERGTFDLELSLSFSFSFFNSWKWSDLQKLLSSRLTKCMWPFQPSEMYQDF